MTATAPLPRFAAWVRRHSRAVWEVLAVNETHARLKSVYGESWGTGKVGNEVLVIRSHHRFSKADSDFLNLSNG